MKIIDALLFYGAVGFLMIGVHQSIFVGIAYSYWLFMFTFILFGLFMHRKAKSHRDNIIAEKAKVELARKQKIKKKRKHK